MIIVMLGTNDTKRRYHLSPEEIGMEMEELLRRIKETLYWLESRHTKILLAAPARLREPVLANGEIDGTSAEKLKTCPQYIKKLQDSMAQRSWMLADMYRIFSRMEFIFLRLGISSLQKRF